jgi:putative ABC transport system permease protein
LIVPGIVIGLLVSFVISRALMSLLWGVSPYDPLATVSVVFLLFSIGLVACWVPARRATRVDPMTALRYE